MKNFISAWHDHRRNKIVVWESIGSPRQRVRREYDASYYYYKPDRLGDYVSLRGERLSKVVHTSQQMYDAEVALLPPTQRFESDFDALERVFQDNYAGLPAPELLIGYLDIEVDYSPAIGFAGPKNPYAIINAITLIKSTGKLFTIAVPPRELLADISIQELTAVFHEDPELQHVILVSTEAKLLELFLDEFHEVDVVTGWNSEFYDMPYIAKRVELVLGVQALTRLGFEGCKGPRWTEKERFKGAKEKEPVIDLVSRVHLDYMRLVKKFNLTARQSYALGAVCQAELGETKLEYDGSLADLYKLEFKKFIEYNIHDARLLVRLEAKFKYIELANQMVHEATVNFSHVFGSVQIIDSAIVNYAHLELKRIVNDRVAREAGAPVEGAIVMTPKPGFYRWIGSCDINSLYPSVIRSLNLSPDKIVGQLLGHEADWKLFSLGMQGHPTALAQQVKVSIDGELEPIELSIEEVVDLCKEKQYAISGYGTILDQSNGQGVLPSILTYWFNGRKQMQGEKKRYTKEADALLKAGATKADPKYLELKALADLYDMRQGVRKVQLNSSYGALLNAFMRFGDPRLGASTTFTGRQITKHMVETLSESLGTIRELKKTVHHTVKKKRNGTIEEIIENEYTLALKPDEAGAIYSDTDSCYFTMRGLIDTTEDGIALADGITDHVNSSFAPFMQDSFNCRPGFESLIKANRELVCRTGLLQAKKKYMLMVVDKEGKRINRDDPDELKTMGSDIKLSSTPEVIRTMLSDVVNAVLNERPREEINAIIMKFRRDMQLGAALKLDPLALSTINSVNEYDKYFDLWKMNKEKNLKVTIPANMRSAINYNNMLEQFKVEDAKPITGGDKVKILWLLPNPDGLTSVAFPTDVEELPEWFKAHYDVDMKAMEQKLVDQKLQNIFDALEWEVPTLQTELTNSLLAF